MSAGLSKSEELLGYIEWVYGLRVGDEVTYRWYHSSPFAIASVVDITDDSIRLSDGLIFERLGEGMGGDGLLVPVTEELREKIYRKRLLRSLRSVEFDRLTNAQIEAVLEIVK